MKRNTVAGGVLIAASLITLAALFVHPTNLLSAGERFASQARLAVWVHAVVIVMSLATFVGLLALTRGMAAGHGLAVVAQVVYGFAVLCITIAAAVSGFAGTMVARRYAGADESTQHLLHEIFHYNSMVNQSFAIMSLVASSLAIILWSAAILRGRALSRPLGITGLVIGLASLGTFFAGSMVLGVHAVILLALGQSIWMVWVGAEMISGEAA